MTGSSAIIAGGSGLVGDELLHLLLNQPDFEAVYALSRRELPLHGSKLHQIIHPELRVTEWEDASPTPTVGFICLGTTKKQAGSKKALEAVDYQIGQRSGQNHEDVGCPAYCCHFQPVCQSLVSLPLPAL